MGTVLPLWAFCPNYFKETEMKLLSTKQFNLQRLPAIFAAAPLWVNIVREYNDRTSAFSGVGDKEI
jgi:hypothetical protein